MPPTPELLYELCGDVPVPPGGSIYTESAFDCEAKYSEAEVKPGTLGNISWTFRGTDVLNENKRIYPREVMTPEITRLDKLAKAGRLFGELDHPTFLMEQEVPALSRASHRITGVSISGDTITIEAVILNNPLGAQLASCYKSKGDVAISHRSMTKWREPTKEDRERYHLSKDTSAAVAVDLRLITFDAVSNPGFKDAFTRSVHVQEARKAEERNDEMPLTREQMNLPENSAVRDLILAEGKALGTVDKESAIAAAVAAAKPGIVTEALAPGKAQIDKLTADLAAANTALETVRGALVTAKVVSTESITQTEAATKIQTLTTQAAVAAGEVTRLTAELATEKAKLTTIEAKAGVAGAVEELKTKHKGNAHLELIVAAAQGAPTKESALAAGEAKAVEIAGMVLKLTGQKQVPNTPQSPQAPADGGAPSVSTERAAVADALGSYGTS